MSLLARYQESGIEAGCDEAGRGCLAGPVVAAAVVLKAGFDHPLLNDSKKLSEKKRELLREIIIAEAEDWAVGMASAEEIDEINILKASFLAMHRAIGQLKVQPALLLIDGNRFKPYQDIPFRCVVGGDAKYQAIAAASILAKTSRDRLMQQLDIDFPVYGWKQNKGYPTSMHRLAIQKHGICEWHRKSFNMGEQLSIEF